MAGGRAIIPHAVAPHHDEAIVLFGTAIAAITAAESSDEEDGPPFKMQRLCWAREWLKRGHLGYYYSLIVELEQEDHSGFLSFLRVWPEVFRELCDILEERVEKIGCTFRKPLEVGLKVAITLRYLATGNLYNTLNLS